MPFDNNSDSSLPNVDFPMVLKVLWSDVVSPILEALAFSVSLLVFFEQNLHSTFLFRYLSLMKSCPVYGGVQLALLHFFQFMQQVSMIKAKAFLANVYQNLLSHHTFQL